MSNEDKNKIFRQASLDRLASPDDLDELMEVTTPRGWMALFVVGLILITALGWGIFGSIPSKVTGTGILLRTGGLADVVSRSSGIVTVIDVEVGDHVNTGDVIARLGQPDLVEKISNAEANLTEQRSQQAQQETFIEQNVSLQLQRLTRERGTINQHIKITQERLEWLADRVASQEQLLEKGLITRQTLLSTRDQYNSAQNEVDQAGNQLDQINVQELEVKSNGERELMASQFRVNEAERTVRTLRDQLSLNTEVISAYTGRVVEITANVGDVIQASTPIANVEVETLDSDALTAVVYVPLAEGKKILPGMVAQIAPTTVKREEYGFMLGDVGYVSAFPATRQGMMRVLANEQLVQTLSAGGAPVAIYAKLSEDTDTPSGYVWSSGQGPQIVISSGTLCVVSVVILEQRPISMVIPYVKEKLGMGSPGL